MLRAKITTVKGMNTEENQKKMMAWFEKAQKVAVLTLKWNHDKRWMTGKDGHHGVRWN